MIKPVVYYTGEPVFYFMETVDGEVEVAPAEADTSAPTEAGASAPTDATTAEKST